MEGLVATLERLDTNHFTLLNSNSAIGLARALEVCEIMTTLIESISEKEIVQLQVIERNMFDTFFDFAEKKTTLVIDEVDKTESFLEIRQTLCRILTNLTAHDFLINTFQTHLGMIAKLKAWLVDTQDAGNVKYDDIRMIAAVCLGNIGRSDEACGVLVKKYAMHESLYKSIKIEVDRIKSAHCHLNDTDSQKASIKILHALTGALKNLSLSPQSKSTIGSVPLVSAIIAILDIGFLGIVHPFALTILKNLTVGNEGSGLNIYLYIV